MKYKSLFELADEYKNKGKFNPKEWRWEYEVNSSGHYSLYVTNKKDKTNVMAYDGAKTLDSIKAVGKMFNVRPKEKK